MVLLFICNLVSLKLLCKLRFDQKRDRHRAQHRDNAYNHNDQADWHTVSTSIHALAAHFYLRNEQQKESDRADARREWITIIVLGLTLSAAFASCGVLYKQLLDARKAASTQHEDSERSFIASNRAFVFLKALGHNTFDQPGSNPVSFIEHWFNSGSTPTKGLVIWHACTIEGENTKIEFSKHREEFDFLLGPQSEQPVLACRFHAQKIPPAGSGKALFIRGGAEYMDIFGHSHKTEYCFMASGFDLLPCDKINAGHNCADEDCQD